MKMRYIVDPKTIVLVNFLLLYVVFCEAEPAIESSLDKATVVDQKLSSAESKLKESESAGHQKVEIKGEQGHKEKFHKENDFKKKDVAHNAKTSSDKAGHESLKAGEESSKVNKKKSDELGHDEGNRQCPSHRVHRALALSLTLNSLASLQARKRHLKPKRRATM